MNIEKQILDYREPFNAPYMIREIAKNVHLPLLFMHRISLLQQSVLRLCLVLS